MKRKLKIIAALCLMATCLFCVPAFAQQSEEVAESEAVDHTEAKPTVSETVAVWFADHSTEFFSALTLCGSLILAFLYKKGFLPILSGALSNMSDSLSNGVKEVGDVTHALSESTEQTLKALATQIDTALAEVNVVASHAGALTKSVAVLEADLKASSDQRTKLETVLTSQMQLFYEFFMAVNLPQYQKERLGTAYNEMLAAIKETKSNDKNEKKAS